VGERAMSRPRIPIGTFGEIDFINRPGGRVEARTRYRDWDGQTRLIQATASSRPAAEIALKGKLAERNAIQPADTTLTPDSPFRALAPGRPRPGEQDRAVYALQLRTGHAQARVAGVSGLHAARDRCRSL